MSDLNVVAIIAAQSGAEGVVRDALSTLADASRNEEGCVDYDLFESGAVPGTFVTVERWRAQEDLDAHLQTDHVAAAFAAAGQHLTGAPAIHPLRPVNPASD